MLGIDHNIPNRPRVGRRSPLRLRPHSARSARLPSISPWSRRPTAHSPRWRWMFLRGVRPRLVKMSCSACWAARCTPA